MKNIMYKLGLLASTWIVLLSSQAIAQNITLNDLFRFHQLNRDQIEDITIAKGFVYTEPNSFNKYIKSHYFKRSDSAKKTYRSVHLTYYMESVLIETSYTTTLQQEYISLKNQLKQRGYNYSSTSSEDDSQTTSTYVKENSPKYVITISQSVEPEYRQNHYTVRVTEQELYDRALGHK